MPNGASSCAKPSLRPSNAHFDVTYGDWAMAAMRPAIDVMLTMAPLRRAAHARQHLLQAADRAAQVDVHHVEVHRRRAFLGDGVAADAGVVDQHVDDTVGLAEDLARTRRAPTRRRRRRARRG